MHGGCDYNHTDYAEGVCANLLPKEPCIKATDVIWWLTLAASWRATWTSISSSGHLKKKMHTENARPWQLKGVMLLSVGCLGYAPIHCWLD